MCALGHTTHAEHEMTPTRVSFRAQCAWEVFIEKVDEEEILLVTLTVNEINKN